MLAMEYTDMLTTQKVERERIKVLESTLKIFKLINYGIETDKRLLLELVFL